MTWQRHNVITMTIERQWIELMKIEVPDAFSDACPFVPEAAFIDAQIKLMAMPRSECPTWSAYIHKQFVSPVRQMFALGATTVVLAFDDYAFVPRAKAITQAKRRVHITPIEFTESEQLPPVPPIPWDAAMANRAFKAKVVELVVRSLPDMLDPAPGSKLVMDWRGTVDEHFEWLSDGVRSKTLVTHTEVSNAFRDDVGLFERGFLGREPCDLGVGLVQIRLHGLVLHGELPDSADGQAQVVIFAGQLSVEDSKTLVLIA